MNVHNEIDLFNSKMQVYIDKLDIKNEPNLPSKIICIKTFYMLSNQKTEMVYQNSSFEYDKPSMFHNII